MPKGDRSQVTNPDAVARRAYELYLQRGSEPGHETEDWLQAEAELTLREEDDGSLSSSADSSSDSSTTPAPEPPGDSAAAQTRKGNTGKRPVRQPQSH